MKQIVVFTDLDGTLLDSASYAWEPALPALHLLRSRHVPVVFCSSKTRAELDHYRRQLDNHEPFVTENGGGIFIPDGYFGDVSLPSHLAVTREGGYQVIRLGAPYQRLRQEVDELRGEGFALTGFGDMTVAEVAALTGLPFDQAAMAKERHFDEPFVFNGSPAERDMLEARVRSRGLRTTRGAFQHLLGDSDKGVAIAILIALFREKLGAIATIALGDSLNDLPMLQRVDHPVAIRKQDGSHEPHLILPNGFQTEAVGPAGWNEAIMQLCGGTA